MSSSQSTFVHPLAGVSSKLHVCDTPQLIQKHPLVKRWHKGAESDVTVGPRHELCVDLLFEKTRPRSLLALNFSRKELGEVLYVFRKYGVTATELPPPPTPHPLASHPSAPCQLPKETQAYVNFQIRRCCFTLT